MNKRISKYICLYAVLFFSVSVQAIDTSYFEYIKVGTQATVSTLAAGIGGTLLGFSALNVLDRTHANSYQTAVYSAVGLLFVWGGYKCAPNKKAYMALLGATGTEWMSIGAHQKWSEHK